MQSRHSQRVAPVLFAAAIVWATTGIHAGPAVAESVAELLERGIFAEQTVGDLAAAIEIYHRIIDADEANRQHVAQAHFRLGQCYLKDGSDRQARQSFEEALAGGIDLVRLDIMLPKPNGFEICRQIREAGLDMPIIMLTAKGQEEDIVRGLELGVDDYVTKPFSIRELLARCAAFLRRRRAAAAQEIFVFGDCRLDLGSHRLFRAGRELALSPKEFRLLELFVQRAGRALTRDEILRTVWGRDILVTSRSVDRCITTLRSKIEPDPRRPKWIHTIRDVGYRFELPEITDR